METPPRGFASPPTARRRSESDASLPAAYGSRYSRRVFAPQTPVGRIGEKALLRHIRSRIEPGRGVVVGVGDDAAAVETGPLTLVTTDSLVEGIHFHREWTSDALLGRKALSVNLSDIDAMGGVPTYAVVSLCLPSETPFAFVEGLYDGLLSRAAETEVQIVGGNLSGTSGAIVVDVTVLGQGDPVLRRSGARPGDVALVTGTLGAAAMGLRLFREGKRLHAVGEGQPVRRCLVAQVDPAPPLGFGNAAARNDLAHAAIDLSDGLSGDLLALCEESGVSAWVDGEALPVDAAAAALELERGGDPTKVALHGGEDYQLLLAASPEAVPQLRELAGRMKIGLTVVGGFAAGPPAMSLRTAKGSTPLAPMSHEHFGGG
jgi:thiamine-monophosphate kinase